MYSDPELDPADQADMDAKIERHMKRMASKQRHVMGEAKVLNSYMQTRLAVEHKRRTLNYLTLQMLLLEFNGTIAKIMEYVKEYKPKELM